MCTSVCVCEAEIKKKPAGGRVRGEPVWIQGHRADTGKNCLKRFFLNLIKLIKKQKHSGVGNHRTSQSKYFIDECGSFYPSIQFTSTNSSITQREGSSFVHWQKQMVSNHHIQPWPEHFHSFPECCACPTIPSCTPHVALEECWPFLNNTWKK